MKSVTASITARYGTSVTRGVSFRANEAFSLSLARNASRPSQSRTRFFIQQHVVVLSQVDITPRPWELIRLGSSCGVPTRYIAPNQRPSKLLFPCSKYHLKNCYFSSSASDRTRTPNAGYDTEKQTKEQLSGDHARSSSKPRDTSNEDSQVDSILKQMRSPPNLITMSRICSTPVLSYLIISGHNGLALGGCVAAAFTDWIDGYIARTYGMKTVLGTYLDPLADKVLVNSLAVSLWYSSILPSPIVTLWLARDVVLCVGTYYHASLLTKEGDPVADPAKTALKVEPTNISKANTVLQFLTLAAGLGQPIFGISDEVIMNLCWITAGTTVASGLSYVSGESLIASGNPLRGRAQRKNDRLLMKSQRQQTTVGKGKNHR